jgi:8-oxo-dGTP pyrophosphatase MutT (NUDIX family)
MQIEFIRQRLSGTLPGRTSHLKMAPEHRAEELLSVNTETYNPKLSAVLVILFHENGKLRIVFIRRSEYVGIHSGQIAFPGGRYEESDDDLRVTAFREVEEEIGVPAESLQLLGHLSDLYVPPSNFLVRAYVAYTPQKPEYKLDEREVQEVLEVDFDHFLNPEIIRWKDFPAHNSVRQTRAPYFDVDGTIIWGATAMMLTELLDLLQ